jgi:poly(3-hydroxybutyrate) depolymerase
MKRFLLLPVFVLTLLFNANAQCDGRYVNDIFSQVDVTNGVQFGQAGNQTLRMDIYQGQGDTVSSRPLLIMCFGGSFVGGSRTSAEIVAFCEAMARKGYVTAAIDYRLESPLNIIFEENMVKAVMRAVQDGKAAVRYFRKDAATTNTYKIDTSAIFMGGTSAGGILSLHVAYMRDTTFLPQNWKTWAADIGGVEGNSGNPGYSSEIDGVVAFAGALGDSAWLNSNNVPFMSIHAEGDGTVPYNVGYPLGLSSLPQLFGSNVLKQRADLIGIENPFYSYTGSNHPPFSGSNGLIPAVMDSTTNQMTRFLYKLLPCYVPTSIGDFIAEDQVGIYPNPVTGGQLYFMDNYFNWEGISVYDLSGREVLSRDWQNGEALDVSLLETGAYILILSDNENGVLFRKKVLIP